MHLQKNFAKQSMLVNDCQVFNQRFLKASYYAGIAFSHNFVGYVHAIFHATGALYGLAHGELNAKLLPIVLEEYGKSVYKTLAKLCDVVGIAGKGNSLLDVPSPRRTLSISSRKFGIKTKLKRYWKNSAVSFTQLTPSFAAFVIPRVPTSSCHRRPS